MGFFDSFSQGIQGHFDRKKEDRVRFELMQREAQNERTLAFEEQFKIDSKIVAIAMAKQDSAKMSGLKKLRATTRARNLQTNEPAPGTFFEKLANYTQKNRAEREKNLANTAEMRKVGLEERDKQLGQRGLVISPTKRQPQRLAPLLKDRKSTWGK